MVMYVINDPVKAHYNVEHLGEFIHNQALDIVRRTCGKFKYRSNDKDMLTIVENSHEIC
jgi:hypothetical protein